MGLVERSRSPLLPPICPHPLLQFLPLAVREGNVLYSVPRFIQGSVEIAIDWNITTGLSNVDGMQIVFFVTDKYE